jgi:DnaK suppressor protein
MTPASKGAAAAKKASASRTAAAKTTAATKRRPATRVAAAVKKRPSTPVKKAATPAKKNVSNAKKAPAAVKKAPTAKTVTKSAPAKKATAVAKKVAAPAKKAAAPAKKAGGKAVAAAVAGKATKAAKAGTKAAKAGTKAGAAGAEAVVAAAPARTTFTPKPKPPAPVRPKVGPYAKDQKFLDEVKELLYADREIYQEQATSLRAEADSLALEREPGDVQFDEESGEGGTVTVDRERNLALSGQALLAVEEIDDALRRIEDKSYGYCERCFQPIPKPRLRALPYARLCVACKSGGLSRR